MAKLYAIVGSIERARVMLEAQAPYLQLRFKEEGIAPHAQEIGQWAGRYPNTRVIVNDDLEAAVEIGVWGVHLGQADLERYPTEKIQQASLQVGISTHTPPEIERALTFNPALLAFGPIFPTDSKKTGHAPQGIERLRKMVTRSHLPIGAIGGIDGDNITAVASTGAAMVAMISYLDRFIEPEEISILAERIDRFATYR